VRAIKRESMERDRLLEVAEELLGMSALPDEVALLESWRRQLRAMGNEGP
jgi:hypothetical protein